jgi:signal transduction histidine kinase
MLSLSPGIDGTGSDAPNASPQDPAVLMTALSSLVASQSLSELATAAARLPDKLFRAEQVVVMLEAPDGVVVGAQPHPGSNLEESARELLHEGAPHGLIQTGQQLAVCVDVREAGVRGVIAITLPSVADGDVGGRLLELARLVSTCVEQLVSRARSAQALKDAHTVFAKGLHDLRTPLNSMRLGMHLLEPGLTGQDPAIVQRTHRAVDRMATLVTEMVDALHKN